MVVNLKKYIILLYGLQYSFDTIRLFVKLDFMIMSSEYYKNALAHIQ